MFPIDRWMTSNCPAIPAKFEYDDIKELVCHSMKKFEGHSVSMEKAEELLKELGSELDTWASFAPEVELNRLEYIAD